MVTRPVSVKAGPHVFKILWSKESWKKHAPKEFKANDTRGLTQGLQSRILVQGWDIGITQQKETLVHELFHACFFVLGFEFWKLPDDGHDIEEAAVLALSPMFFQVMQDNPELVLWLQQ